MKWALLVWLFSFVCTTDGVWNTCYNCDPRRHLWDACVDRADPGACTSYIGAHVCAWCDTTGTCVDYNPCTHDIEKQASVSCDRLTHTSDIDWSCADHRIRTFFGYSTALLLFVFVPMMTGAYNLFVIWRLRCLLYTPGMVRFHQWKLVYVESLSVAAVVLATILPAVGAWAWTFASYRLVLPLLLLIYGFAAGCVLTVYWLRVKRVNKKHQARGHYSPSSIELGDRGREHTDAKVTLVQ